MNSSKLKRSLIIAAAVTLIFVGIMVLFGDKFFNLKPHSAGDGEYDPADKGSIILRVPSEPYYYDGSEEWEPLADVSAQDSNGNDLTNSITVSVTSGGSLTEKELVYAVTDNSLRTATETRRLVLSNYEGPQIQMSGEMIQCHISEISQLNSMLLDQNLVTATDGFGHDISDTLYIESGDDIIENGIYNMTVTAENFLHDRASGTVRVDVTGELHKNPIVLTADSVTIRRGDSFVPMNYVVSAIDPEYGDLSEYIKYDKTNLNPNVEGDYYMSYYIDGFDGVSSEAVTLTITVIGSN